jgi:eukaryotic-like serine/threonine-protein kinase
MTMQEPSRSDISTRRSPPATLLRGAVAGLLGAASALLLACGSSGAGLIPAGNAGPLQSDFEAIAGAAQSANGNCGATEAAILKTEQDFNALPGSVDNGLRSRLSQGIANLSTRAREACRQPLPQSTVTSSTTKSTPTTPTTATIPTTTQTTPTATTPTTTTPTTTGPGGGTAAPNGGNGEPAQGDGHGKGGATEPERSGGAAAGGGQESGK